MQHTSYTTYFDPIFSGRRTFTHRTFTHRTVAHRTFTHRTVDNRTVAHRTVAHLILHAYLILKRVLLANSTFIWYFNANRTHGCVERIVSVTGSACLPVSRFECVSGLNVYWPIIALGTCECGVAKLCRDPTVQSEFFLRVSLVKTFN